MSKPTGPAAGRQPTTALPPIKKRVYLISYDLGKPVRDYPTLYRVLKGLKAYGVLESVWLIVTSLDIDTLFERIQEVLDTDDALFIIEVMSATSGIRSQNTKLDGQKG